MRPLSSEDFFAAVYGDLFKRTGMGAVSYAGSLGYKPIEDVDDFHFPEEGETYLTPEGNIVTKQKGDKGPYGPRLILVEMLTESEKTYGKGIKTGEDALAKVRCISEIADRVATGAFDESSPADWETVDFRKLSASETGCFITPHLDIFGCKKGDWISGAEGKPVYIVRRKQPRKKKVLVLDYEEAMSAMNAIDQVPEVGEVQSIMVFGFPGEGRWIECVVEEREA